MLFGLLYSFFCWIRSLMAIKRALMMHVESHPQTTLQNNKHWSLSWNAVVEHQINNSKLKHPWFATCKNFDHFLSQWLVFGNSLSPLFSFINVNASDFLLYMVNCIENVNQNTKQFFLVPHFISIFRNYERQREYFEGAFFMVTPKSA